MNASRLREILELLIQSESKYDIQKILSEVDRHINEIVSAPQEAQHQTDFAETLERLRNAMSAMNMTFEPAQIKLFAEIGADKYFSSDIQGDIAKSVQDNPITPAVSRDHVAQLLSERKTYLGEINQLRDNLEKIGIAVSELDEGTAEIGFLIPRELFQDQLDQFIKQLGVINRIIREFSETATGSAEEIKIRQISSSDPLLFFGLNPVTIGMIGGAILWALQAWKQVEEIREIRERTSKLPTFNKSELKFFDDKIKKTIAKEIETKAKEFLSVGKDKGSRTPEERRAHITWALKTILALVERGLQVEIRSLPPPTPEGVEDPEAAIPKEYKELNKTIPQLVFPKVGGTPVLDLPPPEPETEKEAKAKPSPSKKTK